MSQGESQPHERFQYSVETVIDKPFNWRQILRLFRYMKPYSLTLLPLALFAMLFTTAIRLAVPALLGYAIDIAIASGDLPLLLNIVIGIAICYLLSWVANIYRIQWMNKLGQFVIYDLRQHLFTHIQRLSNRFFDNRSAGSILVRITNDINSLQDLFTNGVVNLIMDIIMLVGIIAILMVYSPNLTFAIMVILPIMFFISTNLRKSIRRAWQTVRIKQSRINSHLNESIQGIRVTQAYTQEQENIAFFERMNEDNLASWREATHKNALFRPLVELSGAIGTVILLFYGAYLIKTGDLTIGHFVSFAIYLGMFWEPISRLGQLYNQLLVGMASSERIFEFLDEKPSVPEKAETIPITEAEGKIKLEHVYFSYDEERLALKDINLTIKAGQTVALVGHTGSGKTSIVNLVARFYDPTGGRILLDGTDLRDLSLDDLRANISIVLQETFIFSGTIMDNIRFGRPTATDKEVIEAAKAVGAHPFIERLPNGYKTEVEERGSILSMGERQLLSFARTLLANPKILILDEATASIDTESELKIQEALSTLLKGRTAIMIAHRLSTIRDADNIIVLDHGEIIEEGNHEQLMKHQGYYYKLVTNQYKALEGI